MALAMENFKKKYKMRKIGFTFVLYLLLAHCYGQKENILKDNLIKKDTMEYFDIKKFEKDNKNRDFKSFYNEKGDLIEQFMSSGNKYFIERTKKKNSPITLIKVFHLNGSIQTQATDFYDFPIGVDKEYNKEGKLIKEIDNDKNYPFSIDALCELIKEEYGVDLKIKSKVYVGEKYNTTIENMVSRIYEEDLKKKCYLIEFYAAPLPDEGDFYARREICVDGTTGEIIYDDPIFIYLEDGDKIPKSKTKYPSKQEYLKKNQKRF